MFSAFAKALDQLGDPRTRRVFWTGIVVAAVTFAGLWAAIFYLLASTQAFDGPWLGWLDWVLDILGGAATLVLTWLLFPAVITLVVGIMLESVADAVEDRYYPDLPKSQGPGLLASTLSALRFAAILVLLNLLLLVFLFFPPVFPFVFYAVNGYLLGREYFELVALRRLSPAEARALRQRHSGGLLVVGVTIALLLTVPLVNLLTPVVATAAMVHLFEAWRGGQRGRG